MRLVESAIVSNFERLKPPYVVWSCGRFSDSPFFAHFPKQNKTKQNKTKQNKTKQNKTT